MKEAEKNRWLRIYEIFDRRHIHDEELLLNRTGNFLLVNSFLLVAFATLVGNGVWFSYILAIAGIVMCVIYYPLLLMQLKTARLWTESEDKMEGEMIKWGVFPEVDEGEIAPNRRHGEMTKKSRWMRPAWIGGPFVLLTVTLGLWVALLIIAC